MALIEKKLLHYTGKAIADFNMIQKGDKVLACLSGGKDSFALVNLLRLLQIHSNFKFALKVLTIDKGLPGFDARPIKTWLEEKQLDHEIITTNIYEIVKTKVTSLNSYCVLCARLRRGHIYTYAKKHACTKVALGHHREDLLASLLMSIFYNGTIASMPPKLLTDDQKLIVIRPLVYCQEKNIVRYAKEQQFPLVSKDLCAGRENQTRRKMQELVEALGKSNPKVPSNMLHALSSIKPSHLMDKHWWPFKQLEEKIY